MDFTREPLVETIITPKEGFKLIIRASSANSQEEYAVGAVEVVSFGNVYFFRSLEKPKAFLLPMTEYEVVESRETRTVLKKPQIEKSIKIGGGKKPTSKSEKEVEAAPNDESKKREKKRSRKRRPKEEKAEGSKEDTPKEDSTPPTEGLEPEVLQQRRTLLPPPTSLISDQIDRYKNYLVEQGALLPEEMEESEEKVEEIPKVEDNTPPSEEIPPEEKVVDINEEAHVPPEDEES
ncbi:MAG: hypothetical protein KFB93_02545 [Simkaniaceae bacterium]|nr:MAG: hypothetical protein KFB93_02545 [Simkaniaceae bacterium]